MADTPHGADASGAESGQEWLLTPGSGEEQPGPAEPPAGSGEAQPPTASYGPESVPGPAPRRTGLLLGAGLALAGMVLGAGIALALGGHGGSTTFRPAASQGLPRPGSAGGFGGPGADGQGFGGVAGEERLRGTLTAVGSSTVTVRTATGTRTCTVTPATQIVRDGAAATLAQLRVGDQVFVHLLPSSGGRLVVERLFDGAFPAGGPGFGGPGGVAPPQGASGTQG